eukprot:Trichotokara_eunicae@DN10094_c0_g1_i1.p1
MAERIIDQTGQEIEGDIFAAVIGGLPNRFNEEILTQIVVFCEPYIDHIELTDFDPSRPNDHDATASIYVSDIVIAEKIARMLKGVTYQGHEISCSVVACIF